MDAITHLMHCQLNLRSGLVEGFHRRLETSEVCWPMLLTAVAFLIFLAAAAWASRVAAYLTGLFQSGTARLT